MTRFWGDFAKQWLTARLLLVLVLVGPSSDLFIQIFQLLLTYLLGIGLSAKAVEDGGCDLILVYNSGRFRMAGRGSLAGLMPYSDANQVVIEMVCLRSLSTSYDKD